MAADYRDLSTLARLMLGTDSTSDSTVNGKDQRAGGDRLDELAGMGGSRQPASAYYADHHRGIAMLQEVAFLDD